MRKLVLRFCLCLGKEGAWFKQRVLDRVLDLELDWREEIVGEYFYMYFFFRFYDFKEGDSISRILWMRKQR